MSSADDAARAERLAAALRENLKRRKAQMRGRQAESMEPARPNEAPVPDAGSANKDAPDAAPQASAPKPNRSG
ncbi:conserved hypothetical protein [Ancylobacter novellus DSM 506]|uniref:Uncharacterized protein n=1 Tax=Ancylobacter novellus (strain ATCC 8093 / DSM 506 / JCM 20403 / CCM 1077 / IAM 12100 / NBRC 12443 / NCIMB 10456) TaxID=639283 RepID=D7A0V9_ANCN5|nr:hypothetical protein [Ancylobacter novellus]ADH87469.1 conserved hypothetical protein [Ancylobacter novellus DSM 506]